MGLVSDAGDGPVGLDTVAFIYLIEQHPTYLPILEPLFQAIDGGQLEGVTSELTLLETLVVPLRHGDLPLADRYEEILTQSRGLRCVELSREVLRDAAYLRAVTGVKTPDALQLATALRCGASAFVTNDRDLPSPPGLRVLRIDDYRSAGRGRQNDET